MENQVKIIAKEITTGKIGNVTCDWSYVPVDSRSGFCTREEEKIVDVWSPRFSSLGSVDSINFEKIPVEVEKSKIKWETKTNFKDLINPNPKGKYIGYVRIPTFDFNNKVYLQQFKEQQPDQDRIGWIIDIRGNQGCVNVHLVIFSRRRYCTCKQHSSNLSWQQAPKFVPVPR